MSAGALERPVWAMLCGPQAAIAQACGSALRVDESYGPFAAAKDTGEAAQADLAQLVHSANGEVWLVERAPWPAPKGTKVLREAPLVQMVAPQEGAAESPDPQIEPLDEDDVGAMRALALATEPGPWAERTHLYGQFFGIKILGALAAMAGERMRPAPGLAEVSGVCTWPQYRGRGLARRLIVHVMAAQRARGDAPFLHTYAHNHGAIALYRSIGFEIARAMVVTVLGKG